MSYVLTGEHPRIGGMDVCPFIPVRGVTMEECVECAKDFGERIAADLGVPGGYRFGYIAGIELAMRNLNLINLIGANIPNACHKRILQMHVLCSSTKQLRYYIACKYKSTAFRDPRFCDSVVSDQ